MSFGVYLTVFLLGMVLGAGFVLAVVSFGNWIDNRRESRSKERE